MSLAARVLLFAVRVYQAFFSALMPSACKFYPSCSHYAAEAVRIHGARRGSWLALRRVSRCHPFTPGGVDLVPDAPDFRDAESGAGFSPWGLRLAKSQNPQAEARATETAARFAESSAKEARP
jgi:putative membrane protein insertion efficiency factor